MNKVIVYTTIFGQSDSLKPAPAGADRCICFVDYHGRELFDADDTKGWDVRMIADPMFKQSPRRHAWHLRCIPHQLFEDYRRVVWIDASLTLIDLPRVLRDAGDAPIAALRHDERFSPYREGPRLVKIGQALKADIDRQLADYRAEGFAVGHLSIACLIVRDHSARVQRFNATWDAQINKHPGDNTQVSLDYSAWRAGLTIHALQGTRHENPYATHDHLDHRRRRRPYLGASEAHT